MSPFPILDLETLQQWLPQALHQRYLDLVMARFGMTRRRAECFLRLWVYLLLKDQYLRHSLPQAPLKTLVFPAGWVECSCREAADVFYGDQDRGSDRSAGMMLDKLVALGLIQKQFDGNCTQIKILALPDLLTQTPVDHETVELIPDAFDPRCDAIPVANLLSINYNLLNNNTNAIPYRIANILRDWAEQYDTGMRVLRRRDNQDPVGFYILFPVVRTSEVKFFAPPSQGLHLSQATDIDPFEMAAPGDQDCRAVFVRSFVVDTQYPKEAQVVFIQDAQQTLMSMRQDFPNLMDMHTLIIHPSYAELAQALGFQKTSTDPKLPLQWMYKAVDRFLTLDIEQAIAQL
ncbi:hypothetical protein PN498_02565 [Oscillatoria sp. CS-180]|uniref:hypothetical protein n=1 Tax=Oscillatoria sp. CS-180 TaxID=3021720 RepID=UPI00232BCE61|nr:hypothetical protein [Oscillatoria sp. CS-180]MDB9524858.1 hypothetical protein [Oscillatoria sp. CS-180]